MSEPDLARARRVLTDARRSGTAHLLESDAKDLLDAIGIATPARHLVSGPAGAEGLSDPTFPGSTVVLKALAPGLLHKTEAGAVRMVRAARADVIAEVHAMARRLDGQPLAGFLVEERIPHQPGHELLIGLRQTPDFGPVVTVAMGGLHAELFARALREDEALAVFSAALIPSDAVIEEGLRRVAAVRLLTERQRGRPAVLAMPALIEVVRSFLRLGQALVPELLVELEVNPLVVSQGRLVALDGVARAAWSEASPPAPPSARPIEKIRLLLEPRSVAIVGVSEKSMNPGRIILRNLIASGFDRERIVVVKPNAAAVDGVRCVPRLASLPDEAPFQGSARRADLIVLSVAAAAAPELVAEIARDRRGESVILIPGGLEEHPESRPLVQRMRDALERSRAGRGHGPVVNGGNCLGVRSAPGRVDTFFIPAHKLPRPDREPDPVAFLSGSGAFAVSQSSKLTNVNPVYAVSMGNQSDLTVGDYLEALKDDSRVQVFAIYLEGFRPGDGARFLASAACITASGRAVILYRGGRSADGRAAACSHTAAMAGDDVVLRALAREAGVVLADTLEDFEDLVRLFTMLRGRTVDGLTLGALTNAGYESVAMADNLGPFRLPPFTECTAAALHGVLERAGLEGIATVRNPLDVTPILNDAGMEAAARAILEDPAVAVGIIGCVPLTGALQTLPRGEGHGEDLNDPDAFAPRLIRLAATCPKAWVAVVDAGPRYDPLVQTLEAGGVPVFRSSDRALRIFGSYCAARLRGTPGVVAAQGPRLEPELVLPEAPAEAPRWGTALIWS